MSLESQIQFFADINTIEPVIGLLRSNLSRNVEKILAYWEIFYFQLASKKCLTIQCYIKFMNIFLKQWSTFKIWMPGTKLRRLDQKTFGHLKLFNHNQILMKIIVWFMKSDSSCRDDSFKGKMAYFVSNNGCFHLKWPLLDFYNYIIVLKSKIIKNVNILVPIWLYNWPFLINCKSKNNVGIQIS